MRPINLLPPEQAKAAKARRGSFAVVFLVILFIAALGGLWFIRNGELNDATDAVAAQRIENQRMQGEIAALGDADDARRLYADRAAQIDAALAVDIDWGRLLNDLGRVLPPRTWVTAFSVTATEPDPAVEVPTYGSMAVGGIAFDYPDASTWFRTLDSSEWPAVGGAWVASLNTTGTEDFLTVAFQSSVSLTESALSSRASTRVPEISE